MDQQGKNLGGSSFSKTDPQHKDLWATPQEIVDGLFYYVEAANGNYTVALLKNDCSTKWFHYAAKNAIAVVYIMLGRISFISAMTGETIKGNNFSSVAFIFGPGRNGLRSLYITKQKLGELARG